MNETTLNLSAVYSQRLAALMDREKKYLKCFRDMSAAAFTDELKTALSPSSTEMDQHIERLKQCMTRQKIKGANTNDILTDTLLKLCADLIKPKKKSSRARDIDILEYGQLIFQLKVSAYQSLHLMALTLQQDEDAILLEQCSKDNQNSNSYLLQISGNIIYPESM
ncbi:DUF892 family protein [Pedobacter antarcticus]|uniref:Ferritin-like metal-binding protein YciE n=1 Tax=Pedobacter antarcticus TaxID=34086 RepID=A0A1I2AN48_9SPHI|nr:DUF892 family protein [Pedobacter antarcticus]SDL40551.1 Ferritin-like metal-binding protein YciE [Pedobacter antarcticus]SFE44290.1 Ferritin-like metal-binding protein YciE [Pedobacter antarcticus]